MDTLITLHNKKCQQATSGLTSLSSQARLASCGVYARGKFCQYFFDKKQNRRHFLSTIF